MTAWTNLANGLFLVGKRITSSIGLALRDNVMAAFEGAIGAPRLQGIAVASDNNGLETIAVTASDAVTIFAGAGAEALALATASTSFVVGQRYTINAYTGSLRFKGSHAAGSGVTSYVELKKNGTTVASWSTASTSPQARVQDIAITIGDVIEWQHRASASAGSTLSAISVTASDGYIERPVYWLASQA